MKPIPRFAKAAQLAVSHQDLIADFNDLPHSGDTVLSHVPLGVKIHQESYAWNFPFADFFVIMKYQITNTSHVDTLDSVYVGFWNNAVVRNTNLVRPGTPGYFDHTGNGFDDSSRMAYSFDFDGIPGGPASDSYIGVKLLGTTPFPMGVDSLGNLSAHTYYNAWQFRLSSGDEAYQAPPKLGVRPNAESLEPMAVITTFVRCRSEAREPRTTASSGIGLDTFAEKPLPIRPTTSQGGGTLCVRIAG